MLGTKPEKYFGSPVELRGTKSWKSKGDNPFPKLEKMGRKNKDIICQVQTKMRKLLRGMEKIV